MWDNTDLPMYKPSAAETQRNTFSAYYAGNVAKGGVFIQPCGWMGTHDLWEGGVCDSEYLLKSGILNSQQSYLTTDKENQNTPWTMVLDRGYQVSTQAFAQGQHKVVQPPFHEVIFGSLHMKCYELQQYQQINQGMNELSSWQRTQNTYRPV
jgi:hypothetical protein